MMAVASVGGLFGAVGVAAAQGDVDQGTEFIHSIRSVTHIMGIVFSSLLVFYGARAKQRFAGGIFGEAATYTIIGGALFGLAFLQMELNHGFGIDVFAFVPGMQLTMAVRMVLFTATVFAFGWAFYRMGTALKGV